MASLYGTFGGTAAPAAPAAAPTTASNFQTYLGRVVAMIPTEVVSVYLLGRGFASTSPIVDLGLWALICWVLVIPLRIWGTAGSGKWVNIVLAVVAFPVWALAMGGPVLNFTLDAATASLAVLLLAVVGAFLYNEK